jgi:hypothetical protein
MITINVELVRDFIVLRFDLYQNLKPIVGLLPKEPGTTF